ncbi:hypothetical protein [Ruminococcus sp. FC2018]|uniref:hypothetical protein n=1 Tax=Ruminococcus sp. FC2018 TaxID=1410617 RepID=UPI000562277D|nr:hypothetical protein [Ruminococcus sp. FC2018]
MNSNMDQKKLGLLLAMASKKLGTSPQALKDQLERGDLSSALSSLPKDQANSLKQVIGDKNAAKSVLSSPQAQEIYKKLGK